MYPRLCEILELIFYVDGKYAEKSELEETQKRILCNELEALLRSAQNDEDSVRDSTVKYPDDLKFKKQLEKANKATEDYKEAIKGKSRT